MKDYSTGHRDSQGFTARPMTQEEWHIYAAAWNAAKQREHEGYGAPEEPPLSPEEEEALTLF
jgi:hypothetical protein